MCQVVVLGFWNRFDLWSPLAGPRKIAETNCRAVPSTTRKLYLVRKRTIEIGYLPNRSTLLSASTIVRKNERSREEARQGIYFPPIGMDLESLLLAMAAGETALHLAESLPTTNRLPLPMRVLVASSLAKFT